MNVLVPVAAMLLVGLFPLDPAVKAGILMMAVSPLPPFIPGKQMSIGAEKCYAYGLYTALILLAVVIVPVTVAVLGQIYGVDVVPPVWGVARQVVLTALLPLAIGLAVRRFAPALAAKALRPVKILAVVLLLAALIPLLVKVMPAILALIGNGTVIAMALTAAAGLAAGHWLGGPDRQNRAALAMAAAMRHPGIAITIAKANESDKAVTAAILGMLIVGGIVGTAYSLRMKPHKSLPA